MTVFHKLATLPLVLLLGCASGVISYRNIDTVAEGSIQTYGAPKNKSFRLLADANKELVHLTLFEQSECDVIHVRLVDRVRQTLKDGDVIHSEPPSRLQQVQGISGVVVCDSRYGRDLEVSLRVGGAVYRLGKTSATGELSVNLADALKPALYPSEDSEAEVLVDFRQDGRVNRASAGRFSLGELKKREQKLEQILRDLEQLLASPTLKEPANLLLSYKLFAQMRQIDVSDARVVAASTRFLELFLERKSMEAAERVKRNLKALNDAKDLLKSGAYTVPPFVHASLYDDTPATLALQWALGEAVGLARSTPGLCGQRFSWQSFSAQSWPAHTHFVMNYLRYAFGDGFAADMTGLCRRSTGW